MQFAYSSSAFETQYTYPGTDLGAVWSENATHFRVWAPTAEAVTLNLYASGNPGQQDRLQSIPMTADRSGTWFLRVDGNLNGVYYTFTARFGSSSIESCDPYAKAVGVNGRRAMVIDLRRTDPDGWDTDRDPNEGMAITDAVIYELHLRDLSVNRSSGIQAKGKYLGLAETGTHTTSGFSTGLQHIKELGITHVQLMPIYDFGSVDESCPEKKQFNWGYDPVNYNVPEGSYASDPFHGEVRIRELKQMIHALHQNGISVIMDVVYNHVYRAEDFCFNRLVPGYFSRINEHGIYSNGSGCGNDNATERSMVRKYIVDSVRYWMDEYHIDGFRFDLVGLIDLETMRQVCKCVHQTNPSAFLYGEGWSMQTEPTKDVPLCTQWASRELPDFGFFNDTLRDTVRGSVFSTHDPGFVSGADWCRESLEKCFRGAPDWAGSPTQCINYVSCHDNHTLFDRIALALPEASREEQAEHSRLAGACMLLSKGVPFFQAGEELLRSKPGGNGKRLDNTYNSPDHINCLKWAEKADPETAETLRFYQGLIALRRKHDCLRNPNSVVSSLSCSNPRAALFRIQSDAEDLIIGFNADHDPQGISLPDGRWWLLLKGTQIAQIPMASCKGGTAIPPRSCLILAAECPSVVTIR